MKSHLWLVLCISACIGLHNEVGARKPSGGRGTVDYVVYMPDSFMPELCRSRHGGIIYRSSSYDGGVTWSSPEIAVRHNIARLGRLAMARMSWRTGYNLVMVISDPEGNCNYMAVSGDGGQSWKYPRKLNSAIKGYITDVSVKGRKITVGTIRGDMCYRYEGKFLDLYEGGKPDSEVCTGFLSAGYKHCRCVVMSRGRICHDHVAFDPGPDSSVLRMPDGSVVYVTVRK